MPDYLYSLSIEMILLLLDKIGLHIKVNEYDNDMKDFRYGDTV